MDKRDDDLQEKSLAEYLKVKKEKERKKMKKVQHWCNFKYCLKAAVHELKAFFFEEII